MTATSFTPTPIQLRRPDGTTQTFPSLQAAGAYIVQLTVANGGVARPASTYVPHLSRATREGKPAYGFNWARLQA